METVTRNTYTYVILTARDTSWETFMEGTLPKEFRSAHLVASEAWSTSRGFGGDIPAGYHRLRARNVSTGEKHHLDGALFSSREAAGRAAFEAGLNNIMAYLA